MSFLKCLYPILALSFVTVINCHPIFGQQDLAVQELIDKAGESYNKNNFELGLKMYSEAIRLGSLDSTVAYNAACCAALTEKKILAFDFLDKAIELGWIDLRLLKADSDLESLHGEIRWTK